MPTRSRLGSVPNDWGVRRLRDGAYLSAGQSPEYVADSRARVSVFGSNGPIGWTNRSNAFRGIAIGRVGASGSVRRIASPVWLSDNVLAVELNPEIWVESFLYQALLNARLPSLASKTAQPLLTQTELGSIWLPVPSIPEQRAIATVLDAIDEAIERTEAVISATERLRDTLLHQLLTRGLPGWHTEWRSVPGLGTIPADWQVVRLEDVADIHTGRAVNRKATQTGSLEVPYLSVANVKDGYLDLGVVKTMRVSGLELRRYRLRIGDVLFTEGGDADKLGRGTVWRGEIDPCLHQNHVFAARPHGGRLISEFLAAYAASNAGKRYFLGAAKQTTNLASVNSTQLKRMLLPLPKLEEQGRITEILAAARRASSAASSSREGLRTSKLAAADALLTGRVRTGIGLEIALA